MERGLWSEGTRKIVGFMLRGMCCVLINLLSIAPNIQS
jgi:hypothetical protein